MVLLVRGINLGARNKLPMAEFRELLAERGYGNPRTLLQSGNAVVETTRAAAAVERDVEGALRERFGLDVPVLARTARQLAALVERDPFAGVWDDDRRYHVVFLSDRPKREGLPPQSDGGDRWVLRGRELYLWLPDGVQGSALFRQATDKRLGVAATARTWRTVTRLNELAAG